MAHSARYRPSSPGSKRMIDPMRASTGTVPLGSSFDLYGSPTSRHGYNGHTTARTSGERISDVPYRSNHDPRVGIDRNLEAQPISTKTYRDSSQSTKLRTEYAIRPRSTSNTSSIADSNRHPLSLTIPSSSTRPPPLVTSNYDRSASPLPPRSPYTREDPERYLVPASSTQGRHHRVYSHDYASDTGRLDPGGRTARARTDRGNYRLHGSTGRRGYPVSSGLKKGDDIDDYDAYSYTNAREQFEKDSAARLSSQRENYRKERPVSMTGLEAYLPQMLSRKDPRAFGPPPSQRGFDKLDQDEKQRRVGRGRAGSDASRDSTSSRLLPWQRAPVSLHQERDDGYSSYREDHDDHRHSHRRRRRHDEDLRSRERRDERDPRRHNPGDKLIPAMAGGLATAGLASGYSKDALDYDVASRHERHRSRDPSRSYDRDGETKGSRTRGHTDQERRDHRRRVGRSSKHRVGSESDEHTSDEDLQKYRRERSARRRHGDSKASDSSQEQRSLDSETDSSDRRRARRARRYTRDGVHPDESIAKTLVEDSQDHQRRPVSVDPAPAKELEAPPRGILKAPREKFPEEPNAVREGVAPLKDAHKKGIPPGARWTKIDRRLVNPAALEANHERFEERPEYVIVLRVLTKEEIQGYAVKTQEIRDSRYQAERQERRRRREEARRYGRKDDDFSSDDEDEDDEKTPLAIEPSPEKQLPLPQAHHRTASQSVPEPVRPR